MTTRRSSWNTTQPPADAFGSDRQISPSRSLTRCPDFNNISTKGTERTKLQQRLWHTGFFPSKIVLLSCEQHQHVFELDLNNPWWSHSGELAKRHRQEFWFDLFFFFNHLAYLFPPCAGYMKKSAASKVRQQTLVAGDPVIHFRAE